MVFIVVLHSFFFIFVFYVTYTFIYLRLDFFFEFLNFLKYLRKKKLSMELFIFYTIKQLYFLCFSVKLKCYTESSINESF